MPISTPNREADPVSLERYFPPCKLVQEGGLFIPFYNDTAETYIAGEPIIHCGRVCIVQRTILPGKMGTLVAEWIVDASIDVANAGNILQNALVYWDTDGSYVIDAEGNEEDAFGAAKSGSAPTNGFILGRASGPHYEHNPPLSSGDFVCAYEGAKRVRVVCLPGAPTTYGS